MRIVYATNPLLIGEMDQLIMKETNPQKMLDHLLNHHNLLAYGRPMMSIPQNRLLLEENEVFTPTRSANKAFQQATTQTNSSDNSFSGAIYLFKDNQNNQRNNMPEIYGILDISSQETNNYIGNKKQHL